MLRSKLALKTVPFPGFLFRSCFSATRWAFFCRLRLSVPAANPKMKMTLLVARGIMGEAGPQRCYQHCAAPNQRSKEDRMATGQFISHPTAPPERPSASHPAPITIGQKFGTRTVIGYGERQRSGGYRRIFRCDCGLVGTVFSRELIRTQTCVECAKREKIAWNVARKKHPSDKYKTPSTDEYRAWVRMKWRCSFKNKESFPYYADRGITVAPEWVGNFSAFLAHVGPRPSKLHSLDRIDNNRGYFPGNVRWATVPEQQLNKRKVRAIKYAGRIQASSMWAREMEIDVGLLNRRFAAGWSLDGLVQMSRSAGSIENT